jgi:PAS domain S-box-containing protein
MDAKLEDIYVINKNGIVVNTTFKKDLYLNFFNFGEEHRQLLENVFETRELAIERFGIEATTKRLKKYSYQTTKDGNYIIEIGTYSPQADEIVEFIKKHINNISTMHENVISAELYIGSDNPFSLNREAQITEKHKAYLIDVFSNKKDLSVVEKNDNKNYLYEYIFMRRENTNLYKNAVIRIITDKNYDDQFLENEVLKSIIIYLVSTLVVLLLIYRRSLKIAGPIRFLSEKISSIIEGNLDSRAEVGGFKEVYELSKNFNYMLDRIKRHTDETLQQKEEIKAQNIQLESINKKLEKLSIVASKTDNAVSIYDKDGFLEWANEGYERLFGFTFNEVLYNIGNNIIDISNNPDIKTIVNICKKTKQSIDFETKTKTKHGNHIWVQTTLTPIFDTDNNLQKLVAIDSNITVIKQVEEKLTEKNKDITDSINYAKRIQEAILPSEGEIKETLENSFVLHKPRGIVSGDFFWHQKQDNKLVTAAADCTGHGVPGAFMSIIGNAFLKEIIQDLKVFEPSEILMQLRHRIVHTLNKSNSNRSFKDGIDIALTVLDLDDYSLSFAGSFNPLYIVSRRVINISSDFLKSKTSFQERTLYEIKADRFPVGISDSNKQFVTKNIQLEPGDSYYVFTDGYADQFGGLYDKKFKYSRFKQVLLEIQDQPLDQQKEILESTFIRWKGDSEQVDDVLVFGARI